MGPMLVALNVYDPRIAKLYLSPLYAAAIAHHCRSLSPHFTLNQGLRADAHTSRLLHFTTVHQHHAVDAYWSCFRPPPLHQRFSAQKTIMRIDPIPLSTAKRGCSRLMLTHITHHHHSVVIIIVNTQQPLLLPPHPHSRCRLSVKLSAGS